MYINIYACDLKMRLQSRRESSKNIPVLRYTYGCICICVYIDKYVYKNVYMYIYICVNIYMYAI